MTTNQIYQQIVGSQPDDLPKLVLSIVKKHIGAAHRISRSALVSVVRTMLPASSKDLKTISLDRQIRQAIDDLQEMGYPILSDSGTGGYWMASSYKERQAYIAEIESRANKLMSKARKLRSATRTDWQDPEKVTQGSLF